MQRNDLGNGNLTHLGTAPLRLHLHIKLRVFVLKVRLVWFLRLLAHAPLALECCSSNQNKSDKFCCRSVTVLRCISCSGTSSFSVSFPLFLGSLSFLDLPRQQLYTRIHSCREELALSIKSSCSLPHPLLWFPVIGSVHSTRWLLV